MGGQGGGGRQPKEKKEIDNSKFYTILNVKKDATQDEIKKSFRKIAIKEHPDKGGDPEKVIQIYLLIFVVQRSHCGLRNSLRPKEKRTLRPIR